MIQDNNIPAFTLTVDQLKVNVQQWISECIKPPLKPVYLTRKELAQALKISLPTLDDYTTQGIIPHLRLGRSVRYEERTVFEALKSLSER